MRPINWLVQLGTTRRGSFLKNVISDFPHRAVGFVKLWWPAALRNVLGLAQYSKSDCEKLGKGNERRVLCRRENCLVLLVACK